ncbi:hypothetical protein RhiJN_12126 [Ceratobasidium sp. AG-Ba]|nr:hypothetical protein RhiJN_12126 [Ceratobasidium sp. AG-Ba]QRW12738.1 hypothetical protein RhiLY_11737 [Ceratobasidium sp. AG-Ba]
MPRVGVGLGMLALRTGLGRARLRGPGALPPRYHLGQLKHFQRFFARTSPRRQQQLPPSAQPVQEKAPSNGDPKQGNKNKLADAGIVNPVNFPETGVGTFGAGGGLDAVITTLVGLAVVFFSGVAYLRWYKANVLNKIEVAFEPGYDPTLALADLRIGRRRRGMDAYGERNYPQSTQNMERVEQKTIDSIMKGEEAGHYFLLLGPKGAGKATLIIDAMRNINADGVAMCDAHPDLEVFRILCQRLRLGKALNYEYNEDTQTGLFQRRDPREGT